MDGSVGHTAWAPEGHDGRSQEARSHNYDHTYNNNDDHDDDCEGEKTIANLCIEVGRECGQSDNTVAKMMPTDGGVIISMMIMVMMT